MLLTATLTSTAKQTIREIGTSTINESDDAINEPYDQDKDSKSSKLVPIKKKHDGDTKQPDECIQISSEPGEVVNNELKTEADETCNAVKNPIDDIGEEDAKQPRDNYDQINDDPILSFDERTFIYRLSEKVEKSEAMSVLDFLKELLSRTLDDYKISAIDYFILDSLRLILDERIPKNAYRNVFSVLKALDTLKLLDGDNAQRNYDAITQGEGKYLTKIDCAFRLLDLNKIITAQNAQTYFDNFMENEGRDAVTKANSLLVLSNPNPIDSSSSQDSTILTTNISAEKDSPDDLTKNMRCIYDILVNNQLLNEDNQQDLFDTITQNDGRYVEDVAYIINPLSFKQLLNKNSLQNLITYLRHAKDNNHGIHYLASQITNKVVFDLFLKAPEASHDILLKEQTTDANDANSNTACMPQPTDAQNLERSFLQAYALPESLLNNKTDISTNSILPSQTISWQIMHFYEHIYDNLLEDKPCVSLKDYDNDNNDSLFKRDERYLAIAIHLPRFLESTLSVLSKQEKNVRLEILDTVIAFSKNASLTAEIDELHYKHIDDVLSKIASQLQKKSIENTIEVLTKGLNGEIMFQNQAPTRFTTLLGRPAENNSNLNTNIKAASNSNFGSNITTFTSPKRPPTDPNSQCSNKKNRTLANEITSAFR